MRGSVFGHNERILEKFEKDGDILSIPRIVDFEHIFDSRDMAEKFSEETKSEGFTVEIRKTSRRKLPWDVTASKNIVPSCNNIIQIEVFSWRNVQKMERSLGRMGFPQNKQRAQTKLGSLM